MTNRNKTQCAYSGKIIYPDEAKANEAAKAIRLRQGFVLTSYRCRKCRKFHLTTPKELKFD